MPVKEKDILFISISTLITAVAWIGFNIYHVSVTSTVVQSLTEKIQPIDGKFDAQTIDSLKKREKIAPISEVSKATTPSGILQPAKEATKSATESGSVNIKL